MSFDLFPQVNRLYQRLTQQRADDMDNLANIDSTTMSRLDATISSRALDASTAKSNVCTEERLGRLDIGVSTRASETTTAKADVCTEERLARLDIGVSTRASETTVAKANVCTEGRLGRLDEEIRGLKSFQNIEFTLPGNSTTANVTLMSPVDPNKSFILLNYYSVGKPEEIQSDLIAYLFDSDTLLAQQQTFAGQLDKTCRAQIIEFY